MSARPVIGAKTRVVISSTTWKRLLFIWLSFSCSDTRFGIRFFWRLRGFIRRLARKANSHNLIQQVEPERRTQRNSKHGEKPAQNCFAPQIVPPRPMPSEHLA